MREVIGSHLLYQFQRRKAPQIVKIVDLRRESPSAYAGLAVAKEYHFKKKELENFFSRERIMKLPDPTIGPTLKIKKSEFTNALKRGKYLSAHGEIDFFEVREIEVKGAKLIYRVIMG